RRYGRRKHFGTLKSALLSGGVLRQMRPDDVLEALNGVSFDVAAGRTFGIILGLTKREIAERCDEIVSFAERGPFIDAPVKTYSSGMYMRLGFAVAIN